MAVVSNGCMVASRAAAVAAVAGARIATAPTAAAAASISSHSITTAATTDSRLKFDAVSSLSPGLISMVHAQLGPKAKPSHVQELSLQHFFPPSSSSSPKGKPPVQSQSSSFTPRLKADTHQPTQTLIAAETGSGKTIAYLLPLLHHLKATEHLESHHPSSTTNPLLQPRAIILAPTHELARQLAAAAKNLCHIDKLKVLCLSSGGWLDTLKAGTQQHQQHQSFKHPDIIVSTPSRLLSTLQNARQLSTVLDDAAAVAELRRTGRLSPAQRQRIRSQQASIQTNTQSPNDRRPAFVSLAKVQSIVIDEADVLLAPDFGPATRAVLQLARKEQHAVVNQVWEQEDAGPSQSPVSLSPSSSSSKLTLDDITTSSTSHHHHQQQNNKHKATDPVAEPDTAADNDFPFDLVLATATIPTSLAGYLRTSHPNITILASNRLHRLPSRLKADFVDPGGNKMAAVAAQIRKVLSEPSSGTGPDEEKHKETTTKKKNNKILIFMNRTKSVELLSGYLSENGISNVAVTSSAEGRSKKSNAHIKAFLKEKALTDRRQAVTLLPRSEEGELVDADADAEEIDNVRVPASHYSPPPPHADPVDEAAPRVLITTSLLSRGLDFDPSVSHVFLPDRISYSTSGFGARRLATAMPGISSSSSSSSSFSESASSAAAAVAPAGINELELLHRAGRAARAGQKGRVVIFDKRAASALGGGAGGSSAAGANAGKRAKPALVRNKLGKWVPKAASPLRKALRGLSVPKHRSSSSSSFWSGSAASSSATTMGKATVPGAKRSGRSSEQHARSAASSAVAGRRGARHGSMGDPSSRARITARSGNVPPSSRKQTSATPSLAFPQQRSRRTA